MGSALRQGAKLLEDARISAPRLTAEVLLAHALHHDRAWLYGHPEQKLREVEWLHYGRYLHQRLNGVPTQYITRTQEFYGRPFRVTPDVLIPRPETEHVVEAALAVRGSAGRILDAGCGSGAIAVTLQIETGADVWATDISQPALRVAADNASRLGARVNLVACDLVDAIAGCSIDVLVSNPPYVPEAELEGLAREVRDHEPRIALTSGPTGFEIYERLISGARRVLRPGGRLILELGYNGSGRVQSLLDGFEDIRLIADLAGIPRVVSCALSFR
ncbi:MAG TPA: peptide chain release factor N(5)-glutamine methyltransferase [Bryobacteraceae bacterium]|nr:peptide chain release factor N(5)-glutamine methyltransferase [Bryobacteraceae bacterium]